MGDDSKAKANKLKDEGNTALQAGKTEEAVKLYSEAISLDISNHVLYSNRSAAYTKLGNYEQALDDAEATIKAKPDWGKGYSRKGAALAYLNRNGEAAAAYAEGLKHDPNNQQLKDGLEEVKAKIAARQTRQSPSLGFDDPNLFAKLAMDPRTKDFLSDPEYVAMIKELQQNPKSLGSRLNDKRLMATLSVLLGMNINMANADDDDTSPPPSPPKKEEPSQKKEPEKMEVDKTAEETEAMKEKEQGNQAYKTKKFEEALIHYHKAVELDPTDMTFLSNIAAVHFEMKDYDKCIEMCHKAVEVGRENRADFKLIAKAYTRIGNAYRSLKDWRNAKIFFEKSLSEHRTPQTRELLSKVERQIKEEERRAYINPELAEQEKQKGNELFTKGDYAAAVKHYSEAVKRNPTDAKLYSNRAACYTKLAAFDLGLKDCDECIRLDPNFVKGYVRKGKILQGLNQHDKAMTAYQKAIELDSNCQEAVDGYRQCMMEANSDPEKVRERAMNDPEVQSILKDPAMRLILEQMQQDPKALQDHLKNPDVAAKIQKLLQSGLIAFK